MLQDNPSIISMKNKTKIGIFDHKRVVRGRAEIFSKFLFTYCIFRPDINPLDYNLILKDNKFDKSQ